MSGNNIRTCKTSAAIPAFRIAKFGSDDETVALASASTDALAGISQEIDAPASGRVDLAEDGPHSVQLGGPVTRGDFLTAGTDGKAVKCTTGNYIAQAKQSGVAGDIIYIHICRGVI